MWLSLFLLHLFSTSSTLFVVMPVVEVTAGAQDDAVLRQYFVILLDNGSFVRFIAILQALSTGPLNFKVIVL